MFFSSPALHKLSQIENKGKNALLRNVFDNVLKGFLKVCRMGKYLK